MARPRFSEALVMRRHELGLSVSQASKILKLREDVLIAFEEGDYDHLPQSGYAQQTGKHTGHGAAAQIDKD